MSTGVDQDAGGINSALTGSRLDRLDNQQGLRELRKFQVACLVKEQRIYLVDARTSEEAESIAENVADDPEYEFQLEDREVEVEEAYPVEE